MQIKNIDSSTVAEIAAYVCGGVKHMPNIGDAASPVTIIRYQGDLVYHPAGQMCEHWGRDNQGVVVSSIFWENQWETHVHGASEEQLARINAGVSQHLTQRAAEADRVSQRNRLIDQKIEQAADKAFLMGQGAAVEAAHRFLGLETRHNGRVSIYGHKIWRVEIYLSGGKRIVLIEDGACSLADCKENKQKVKGLT